MRITALVKDGSGVDYHRIKIPLQYFPYKPGDTVLIADNRQPFNTLLLATTDVLIYSRDCPFDIDEILNARKKYGFKIVVDIDDYWHLSANHPMLSTWISDNMSHKIVRSIGAADLITTTHEYLAKKIEIYNKRVVVLPNAVPFGKGQFTDEVVSNSNILYSCGASHLHDLKHISTFLQFCAADVEIQKYKLCIAGLNTTTPESARYWKSVENAASLYGEVRMWRSAPLEQYMLHYKYASVALAPLEDSEFNRCKSWLKALEGSVKKLPVLASAVHPFTEVPVIHCKTQRDWFMNLKKLIKRPELAKEHGEALHN